MPNHGSALPGPLFTGYFPNIANTVGRLLLR
jgi:hypothetical protein